MSTPPTPPRPRTRPGARTRFTLRRKLTVSLMTVGLSSLLLAGLVYVSWDLVNRRGAVRDRMRELAERVGEDWAEAADIEGSTLRWSLVLLDDPWVGSAALLDAGGSVLVRYSRPVEGSSQEAGHSLLAPIARVPVRSGTHNLGIVVVRASAAPLWQAIALHGGVLLTLIGTSVLLTLGLSHRIHRRFSDQLLDLARAANAISTRKDYSIRAVRRSDDELGLVVDTFNHMITQIELRDLQLKAEIERAEAARTAKSQFLATMSHEIRTPINGVLGMTQLLLETPLSKEQGEFARTIHGSAEGLLSIINDILDFSKGEAGRYELEATPFEPGRVVEGCLDTIAFVAAEKELEVQLVVDPDLPGQLVGDPARLRQVLLNLLSNALKFTSQGEITVRVLLQEDQGEKARIRFEVQDTGIGVPPDRVDRLFESFTQVDATHSRKYGGTGLGLAISRQIVEAMGGTMFVRSEVGVGSTFGLELRLPVAAAAASGTRAAAPRGRHILIADPGQASAENVARLLHDGNTVEVVHDAPSARTRLGDARQGSEPFDLALIDVGLVEALVADSVGPWADLPLVVLAPVNRLSAAAALPWPGPRAALVRPIKPMNLSWCIHELMRAPGPALPSATPVVTGDVASPHSPLRVLVVEDHPVNQRITTRFLEKLGATWELAGNGREALEAIERSRFDLVLMDVQMPVMDGLEATLAIRELEAQRGGHLPVIALSANVLDEHRREAQAAGFDDYLPKPVRLDDLRARLEQWAPGSRGSISGTRH